MKPCNRRFKSRALINKCLFRKRSPVRFDLDAKPSQSIYIHTSTHLKDITNLNHNHNDISHIKDITHLKSTVYQ